MSDPSPLLVPVELDALVVNRQTRDAITVERIPMAYNADPTTSPEPAPFTNQEIWKYQKGVEGVYLHWILPQALRHGRHETEEQRKMAAVEKGENPDAVTGDRTVFPLVPNRWLVVRYAGTTDSPGSPPACRDVAAWVVESDAMYTQDKQATGSGYLDETGKAVTIGKKVHLESWTESGNGFGTLRAVAPGNHAFASYQPTNENVFSIHDPLEGVHGSATLSYLVVGWYADSDADILAGVDALESLQWTLAKPHSSTQNPSTDSSADASDAPAVPSRSVYHGLTHSIPWSPEGEAQTGIPSDLTLSVGSTGVEALTAFLQVQAAATEHAPALHPEVIEALLLGMITETEAPQRIRNAAHELGFFTDKGGHAWTYRDATSPDGSPAHDFLPPNGGVVETLNTLNRTQAEYDAALRTLHSMQHRLYGLWWKKTRVETTGNEPPGWDAKKVRQALNPNNQNGLLHKVHAQTQKVATLQKKLDDQKGGEATPYQRIPRGSYWQTHDPVFLIAGAEASHIPAGFRTVTCRRLPDLVQSVTVGETTVDATVMGDAIPTPNGIGHPHVPDVAKDLLVEFFFLDPSNAALISSEVAAASADAVKTAIEDALSALKTSGALDAAVLGLDAWTPPWTPLYVSWHVEMHPIAYVDADTQARQWDFDGTRYTLRETVTSDGPPLTVRARSYLSPQNKFTFKRQLQKYLQDRPPSEDESELEPIKELAEAVDGWDFVSLSMRGVNERLAALNPLTSWMPGKTGDAAGEKSVHTLVGDQHVAPAPGSPSESGRGSGFQQVRSAQMKVVKLRVVDRFGQYAEASVHTPGGASPDPIIPHRMAPTHPVVENESHLVQLAPRLLQPGRLAFDFVCCQDPQKLVRENAANNPVCAWLLPNHLDRSVVAYAPDGTMLGELRVVTNAQDERIVDWTPAPGGTGPLLVKPDAPEPSQTYLPDAHPHLARVLQALQAKGEKAFAAFASSIDATLWTTDPLGNRSDALMSVMVGRPLALVRTRLKLQLSGIPLQDTAWAHTFSPQPSEVTTYPFDVRLGEATLSEDGLIGFYRDEALDTFNAVHAPDADPDGTPSDYVRTIGQDDGTYLSLRFVPDANDPGAPSGGTTEEEGTEYVTLLMDPRASVHAVSDVLPVRKVSIPPRYVKPALARMAVSFITGPLLSRVKTSAADADGTTTSQLLTPHPKLKQSAWTWMQEEADDSWTTLPVGPEDDRAHLSDVPNVLRSGYLVLRHTKDGAS